MDLNISYHLEEHGWSTCFILINGVNHELCITHIFPQYSPIEDCINSLSSIIKGEKESTFYWYGEPGGEKICLKEIPNLRYKVKVTSTECDHFYEKQSEENKVTFEIEITKKLLITQFYFEFKKISTLMKEKDYSKNRASEFPTQQFKTFEKIALEYIGLN